MYTLDRTTNRISPLKERKFSELGFKERNHLQEWICNQPDALGEELLIIQKEFNGFDETNERLDLLALDKMGNLVIIENKLDDSGKDVVWQALKYASYCTNFNNDNIVDIYQQYLYTSALEHKNAYDRITEFLKVDDLEEISLNSEQRIILVAVQFRKEVTSTALWLLKKDVRIQCIKVTPYTLNDQCFINVDQIIPTPETSEFVIGIANKENAEKNANAVSKQRYIIRAEYWKNLLDAFNKSECNLFNNISASKDHWLSAGSGVSACPYQLIFGQKVLRICLNLDKAHTEENKFLFDYLYQYRDEIETSFDNKLEWLRLDDKKSSRIEFEIAVDGYNKEEWENHIKWHISQMTLLEKATKKLLEQANSALKRQEI